MTYADERNLRLKRRKLEQVKWLIHLAQKGMVPMPCCSQISEGCLMRALGVKQAATDRENTFTRNWGTLKLLYPLRWDARMPACRREGGGDVVIERFPVMGKTR